MPRNHGDQDNYHLRVARLEDEPALQALIARSIRALGAADYSAAQIEAALRGAFGVDTQLIRDGSYFVVVTSAGEIVACLRGNEARLSEACHQVMFSEPAEISRHVTRARAQADLDQ